MSRPILQTLSLANYSSCYDDGEGFGVDITRPDFDATLAMIEWSHMTFNEDERFYADDFLSRIMPRVDFERVVMTTHDSASARFPSDWSHVHRSMLDSAETIRKETLGRVNIELSEAMQLRALAACDPTYVSTILTVALIHGKLAPHSDPVVATVADGPMLGLIEMCVLAQKVYGMSMTGFVGRLTMNREGLQATIDRLEARITVHPNMDPSLKSRYGPDCFDTRLSRVATALASLSLHGAAPSPTLWNEVLAGLHCGPADASRDSLLHLLMERDARESDRDHIGCYEHLIDAGFAFDRGLHHACAACDLPTVRVLLSRDADPLFTDIKGLRPIDVLPQPGPTRVLKKSRKDDLDAIASLLQAAMARQEAMNAVADMARPGTAFVTRVTS